MANYFKDRVVEHPGRVTLTPTGGTNEYDVNRAEGTVSEAGSPINAATLNTAIDTYGLWYGTCSTSANTAEKVVTCAGFTLTTGAKISVHFSTANRVVGRIQLNVNGTGAINVLVNDQYSNVGGSCTWDPGQDILFTYDGANWRSVNGAIINDDELDTIETALSLSHDGPARLYKILNKLVDRFQGIDRSRAETITVGTNGFVFTPNHSGMFIANVTLTGAGPYFALRQGIDTSTPSISTTPFPDRTGYSYTSNPVMVKAGLSYYASWGNLNVTGMTIYY